MVVAAGITLAGCGSGAKAAGSKQVKLTSPSTTTTVTTLPTATTLPVAAPTTIPATVTTRPSTTPTTVKVNPTTTTSMPGSGGDTVIQLTSTSKSPVSITVGESVELTLSNSGMSWSNLNVSPAGLLAPDPSPSPPAHGILAIWTAVHAGTATVTATGVALCAPTVACPMYARLYSLTIVIS